MKLFNLVLCTPDHTYYKGEVYQLTVQQEDGIRQILANHEPSIGLIVAGKCSFLDGRKINRVFITGEGILSVTRDCVTVSAFSIQSERAFAKSQEDSENDTQKEIERRQKSREEYVRSKLELAKALSGKRDEDK